MIQQTPFWVSTGTNKDSYNPPTDRIIIQSSCYELFHDNTVPNLVLENSHLIDLEPPPSQTLKI